MHKVKRLGVMSVAKVLGAMYAGMGLIIMPFFLISAAFGAEGTGWTVALAIMVPFLYGIGGFVGGAFMAWVYNVTSEWIGGIEVEVELARPASSNVGLI